LAVVILHPAKDEQIPSAIMSVVPSGETIEPRLIIPQVNITGALLLDGFILFDRQLIT
jgi:hypothetical protein